MRQLLIDIDSRRRLGDFKSYSNVPVDFQFQSQITYQVQFLQNRLPFDLTNYPSWLCVVDSNYNDSTYPIIYTQNDEIDKSRLSDGILTIPFMCDSTVYESFIDSQPYKMAMWELQGFDINGAKVIQIDLKALLHNCIDPSSATPPEPYSDWYTKPQVDALIAGVANKTLTGTAGESISALRAVRGDADGKIYYCDADDADQNGLCLGISTTAANSGSTVSYVAGGVITDSSWSWVTTTPIWIGTDGALTQTVGAQAFCQIIAIPVTDGIVSVNIKDSFKTT